jgi:hypothetical protein
LVPLPSSGEKALQLERLEFRLGDQTVNPLQQVLQAMRLADPQRQGRPIGWIAAAQATVIRIL